MIKIANRCLLHKSKLEDFKTWLINDGWTIEKPKGIYEVLRATKPHKKPLIIFEKDNSKEHYSVQDIYIGLVYQFIRNKNATKNPDQSVQSSHA